MHPLTRYAVLAALVIGVCAPAAAQPFPTLPGPCPTTDPNALVILAPAATTVPLCFTPAADHAAVDIDDQPLIVSYRVLIFRDLDPYATGAPRRPAIDIGKPGPNDANVIKVGNIPADVTPGQRFRYVVETVGRTPVGGGTAPTWRSEPSGPFGFRRTTIQGAPGRPAVVTP